MVANSELFKVFYVILAFFLSLHLATLPLDHNSNVSANLTTDEIHYP